MEPQITFAWKEEEQPHQRMRRLRDARRLSLQNLADAVGLSKAHTWELERSTARMEHASYINLCNIAAALGVSVSVLMQSSAIGAAPTNTLEKLGGE